MELITDYNKLPICTLIQKLKEKNENIKFDDLKNELELYNDISFKDDEQLAIVYYNRFDPSSGSLDSTLENTTKSIILEKESLKPLTTQFNKIIYNDNAYNFLKEKNWDQVVVNECHEGTMIIFFNHNEKWYISTRRCLDSTKSTWIKNNSYYDMVQEAMENIFTLDELNPDHCYHFVLVHHKNKNLVSPNQRTQKNDYKELYHVLTTEKYTFKEVDNVINDKVNVSSSIKFNSIDDMIKSLNVLSDNDIKSKKISSEGYVCRYYTGEVGNSPFITFKFQTEIYQTLTKLKPNNSNIYQCYLHLYKTDKLKTYLPYFGKVNGIVTTINSSLKNLSQELLNAYHMTRNHKNEELYKLLPGSYKTVIYDLHGIYMKKSTENNKSTPININSVYFYLKSIPLNNLVKIYTDRVDLLTNPKTTFVNKTCIHTSTLTSLMLKD